MKSLSPKGLYVGTRLMNEDRMRFPVECEMNIWNTDRGVPATRPRFSLVCFPLSGGGKGGAVSAGAVGRVFDWLVSFFGGGPNALQDMV